MICSHLGPHHVTIRMAEFSYVASFQGSRNGAGLVEFSDGRRFMWGCTDIWETEWVFVTEDDMPLLRFKTGLMDNKSRGQVEVFPTGYETPELSLLLLLGCYFILLMEEETSCFYLAPLLAGKSRSLAE